MQNKNSSKEFEKSKLNLINVAPKKFKINVRCSVASEQSGQLWQQLVKGKVQQNRHIEQPSKRWLTNDLFDPQPHISTPLPRQHDDKPSGPGYPDAVGHELSRRDTLFNCRGSQTRNTETHPSVSSFHLTRCRFAHRSDGPVANPSCLGDIQYFNSRLTTDKRGGGVYPSINIGFLVVSAFLKCP